MLKPSQSIKPETALKIRARRPKVIHYSLSDIQKEVIRVVRTLTWCPLDDLVDTIKSCFKNANRSNVYRTLKEYGISSVPDDKKREARKFKEYQPGYLHMSYCQIWCMPLKN